MKAVFLGPWSSLLPWTYSMFCILAPFVYSSEGPVLLSITSSAWHKYCYLQIEWVALIFLLAWGKQQATRGNVYLAPCHDCDERHLNRKGPYALRPIYQHHSQHTWLSSASLCHLSFPLPKGGTVFYGINQIRCSYCIYLAVNLYNIVLDQNKIINTFGDQSKRKRLQ